MKKRLLVVEDDAHIRLGLCEALRAEGYDVIDCRDGAQAGPLVKQQKPDLVILDIMLPRKSGFDLCREIRAAKNRVPILRSEEHTSELQSQSNLVCRLLLEKKKLSQYSLAARPVIPVSVCRCSRSSRTHGCLRQGHRFSTGARHFTL